MNPRNFFAELKRRNVYRVAVAYAVVAWLLIQIATQVFPFFEIPNWAVRLVVLLLALGFPIALILAWAFEVTPEGIQLTTGATTQPGVVRQRMRRPIFWSLVGLGAAAASLLSFHLLRPSPPAAVPETASSPGRRALAVLPFENLSEDKANAYFADGMQDEIITRLAKIGDLKVISRTSTLPYRTKPEKVSEVARQLGVGHVVEGSVQRIADRVRINVQLIEAATDEHLWAELYDRNVADVFAMQTEVATKIAGSLQAKLSGREQEAMAEKLTQNVAAYDAYLRGIDLDSRPGQAPEDGRKAAEAFAEAVLLDPQFAQAWARLSRTSSHLFFLQWDGTSARQELARSAAETATRLNPAAPETLLANAYYRYHVQRDYGGARVLFDQIRREVPSSGEALTALARIARRQSRWSDSTRLYEEAAKLNPRDPHLFMDRSWTFSMLRDYGGTLEMIERAEAIFPGEPDVIANKAHFFQWRGDLKAARAALDRITDSARKAETEATQLILERRYPEAARVLEGIVSRTTASKFLDAATSLEWLGSARLLAGDLEGAKTAFLKAKPELEKFAREQPKNFWILNALASAEAGLGNKEAALRAAEHATEVAPAADDPVFNPIAEENLAGIEARMGEPERAIARIERLLQTPYGAYPLTQAELRLEPTWDALRSHPRFKAIVEGPEPKTTYK